MPNLLFRKKINTQENNLTSNLRYLMNRNEIDATSLSKHTGIAVTTINTLKRGVGNPTLSTLQLLANYFNITIGQLTESNLDDQHIYHLIDIPILEPQLIHEFLITGKFDEVIPTEIENDYKHFAVKITNNSMAPLFEKGTVFVICTGLQPQDGDIVLVKFGNQIPCFRKIYLEEENYIFTQVSELLGNEISKNKNFSIFGVITKAIQNFHK